MDDLGDDVFCLACLIRGLSCDALDMNVQLFQLSLEDAAVMRTAIDEKGSWATSLGQPKPAKDRQTLLLALRHTHIGSKDLTRLEGGSTGEPGTWHRWHP